MGWTSIRSTVESMGMNEHKVSMSKRVRREGGRQQAGKRIPRRCGDNAFYFSRSDRFEKKKHKKGQGLGWASGRDQLQ